jgi:hypothetical protein
MKKSCISFQVFNNSTRPSLLDTESIQALNKVILQKALLMKNTSEIEVYGLRFEFMLIH